MESRQRIAVIGASRDRRKYGNKCVRAYLEAGWEVFPVNPAGGEMEGRTAFSSLDAVPQTVDRIALYTPPPRTLRLLPSLPRGVEIFFNPGTADASVLEEARRLELDALQACAIVAIGRRPAEFPEV